MRTRVALLACLFGLSPALVRAQNAGAVTITESSTASQGGLSDGVINIAECNGTVSSDTLALQWNLAQAPTSASAFYRIFASSAACQTSGNMPSGSSSSLVEITNGFQAISAQTGSWTTPIPVRNLTSVLASTCGAAATITFCVYVSQTNSGTPALQTGYTASGSVDVDVAVPGQPTNVSTASGDGALTVAWTAASGTSATSWQVVATPGAANGTAGCNAGGAGPVTATCSGASTTSCRITGLTNDACYSVTVQAFSVVDNPSPISAAASGVPRPVQDFWERYQASGGREQGGCQSGAASALALLALAAAAPRLRRRRP